MALSGRKESWADQMSLSDGDDNDAKEEEAETNSETSSDESIATDACECMMQYFPVPGELWVQPGINEHAITFSWLYLCASLNYLSSLLKLYPPCKSNEMPYIINSWREFEKSGSKGSPFRIVYGTRNPAMRGVIVTSSDIIPNFSWTPRLLVSAQQMLEIADRSLPPGILCVPAMIGNLIRLFQTNDKQWYIANNEHLEQLYADDVRPNGHLGVVFETCLSSYAAPNLKRFLKDLSLHKDRVWFFGLFPSQRTLLALGTCRQLPHSAIDSVLNDEIDLDFNLHACIGLS